MPDLRYAWRSLCATPRLTLAASACAALGLGAAIFMTTLVDAVLFATPPLPNADRLVRIWTAATSSGQTSDLSYPEVRDLQARAQSLDTIEAVSRTRLAVTTEAGTERVRGESVTPGYFGLLGIRPTLGRLFDASEYAVDAPRPVLIGHDMWQRRYGGSADVLGQPFRTRPTGRQSPGSVRTIVGVMPPGFVGTVDPDVAEFWIPIAHYEPAPNLTDRMVRSTWVIARRRSGVSMEAVRAEVAAIAADLTREHPAAYDRVTLSVESFGESWRERFRLSLFTLLGAAGLLLLIACTNIATLLLARLAGREQELRVRVALGAARGRLLAQLLAESLIIAVVGGAAGLALAAAAVRAFATGGLFALPPYVQIGVEPRSAIVGVALVILTGLVFGVLPAKLGAGAQAAAVGRDLTPRISMGRRQKRYGQALVVAQVAFTFLLLAGATLLNRTYRELVGDDLGYRTENLLRMAVSPDPNVFTDPASRLALASEIKRAFDAYPGVARSALMAGVLPPWFDDSMDLSAGTDLHVRDVGRHAIGPDFLEVMGMRVVSGRTFDAGDRNPDADRALASETLASVISATTGRDPIGQRVRLTMPGGGMAAESLEIVGIVNDVAYNGPLRPRAPHDLYVPLERGGPGAFSLAIHSTVDPATLIEPLSRELGRLAPSSPQHWISTMTSELALQYRDAELYASLSGVYGVAAALLSILGIYSVLANNVSRRHRELGVRMALGARAVDIVRLVLVEGAGTLIGGVAIGAVLTVFSARLIAGLLYGVAPQDPVTFLVVSAGLILVGLMACAIPARRASRVNPLSALRMP